MKTIASVLFILLTGTMWGQTYFKIKRSTGNTDSIAISKIQKIYFNKQNTSIPKDSLVAYYPLDSFTNDSSGQGHNGVNYGAEAAKNRFRYRGKSMYFNASANISIENFPTNYENVTVCAWIKAKQTGSNGEYREIFDTWSSPGITPYRLILFSDSISFWYENMGFQRVCCVFRDTTNWHFITGTREKVGSMYKLSIYIDGVLKASNTGTLTPAFSPASCVAAIGQRPPYTQSECFLGWIDEVRIYKRALKPEEILALYRQ